MNTALEYLVSGLIGGGLIQAGIALFRARSEVRRTDASTTKDEADAAAVLTETSLALLKPLRDEITEVRGEVHSLRAEVQTLRAENAEYRRLYGPLRAV